MKIKTLILTLVGILAISVAQAKPANTKNVLLEKVRSGGFVLPEYQGIYRFQVLKNGEVLNIDNKNKVTKLAVLSPTLIKEVETAINALPEDLKVVEEDAPRCTDIPLSHTYVYNNKGKKLLIRTNIDCVTGNTSSAIAVGIADWIQNLQKALTDHFYINDPGIPARIGQEGYGAPEFREARKILRCNEERFIADDGFSLYLEEIPGTTKEFKLVVERSLFTGPATETYRVENKTDPHLLGSPARYENETVKLSVQGTVTPRPDHKLPGSFIKQDADGTTEVRKLLCNYID